MSKVCTRTRGVRFAPFASFSMSCARRSSHPGAAWQLRYRFVRCYFATRTYAMRRNFGHDSRVSVSLELEYILRIECLLVFGAQPRFLVALIVEVRLKKRDGPCQHGFHVSLVVAAVGALARECDVIRLVEDEQVLLWRFQRSIRNEPVLG